MPQAVHLQSNFTLGEIDERLHARTDLDVLTKGAKRARNVVTLPQGGLRRRFGTEYIATAIIMTAGSEGRIAMFEYSDETKYLLLFEHLSLKIYHNDALVSTEVSPYSKTQLPNLKFTQSSDQFFTVHPDVAPYVLIRTAAHASWTYAAIAFTYYPTQDFDHNYDAITFTLTGGAPSPTEITAGAAIFKASHAGGLFFGAEGTFRIVTVNNSTTITGFTIDSFKTDTTTIDGKLVVLTEPVWSAALGYPRCVTFFQNRLCYGGSKTLPQGVWMSKTNNFANFDDSEALATSSIGIYIHTNNSNIVEDIIGERAFLIFTSTGLVSTQMMDDAPLTITNVAFNLQNNDGIGLVRPAIFDNKVTYMDRGGKILWGVSYEVQKGGHVSIDLSIASQALLDNPVDMAAYRNPDIDNGNYLILVNEDGSLAILQAMENQNVLGWTKCITDPYVEPDETPTKGMFRHIAASESTVYFIVERYINSVTAFYIEKLDFGLETDSTSVQTLVTPGTAITGLAHLNGEEVMAIGDGILQNGHDNPQTVVGGGITLGTAATDIEVGLNYRPLIIPLPVSVATQTGNDLYLAKRIKTFWIDYYESIGIYVDDQLIPFLTLDESTFDDALPLITDFYATTPMHGWEPRAEIVITQYDPYPMIVRGTGMEIEV